MIADRREIGGDQHVGEMAQLQVDRGELDVDRAIVRGRQEVALLTEDPADLVELHFPDLVDPLADDPPAQRRVGDPPLQRDVDASVEQPPPIRHQHLVARRRGEPFRVGPFEQDEDRRHLGARREPHLVGVDDLGGLPRVDDVALGVGDHHADGRQLAVAADHPTEDAPGHQDRPGLDRPAPAPARPARCLALAHPPCFRSLPRHANARTQMLSGRDPGAKPGSATLRRECPSPRSPRPHGPESGRVARLRHPALADPQSINQIKYQTHIKYFRIRRTFPGRKTGIRIASPRASPMLE